MIDLVCRLFNPVAACRIQSRLLPMFVASRRWPQLKFRQVGGLLQVEDHEGKALHFYSPRRAGRYIYPTGIENIKNRMREKYLPGDLLAQLGSESVVIDVGANIGEFAMALPPVASVFAFEPDAIARSCLVRNVDADDGFEIYSCALSDKEAVSDYFISSEGADSSLIQPMHYAEIQKVITKTLDEIILKKNIRVIDLIKVEAEGGEPEVLKGSLKSLSNSRNVVVDVSPERRGESTEEDVESILSQCGFSVVKINESVVWGRKPI